MAGGVPSLVALAWGDPLGGFLWAGCLRMVAQYHSTFAINSIAHRFGRRPYLPTTSARDNVLVALVNAVAALFFLFVADFDWTAVVLIAVGSALGGQIGAKVGRRFSPAVLRILIVTVGTLAIVQLLLH